MGTREPAPSDGTRIRRIYPRSDYTWKQSGLTKGGKNAKVTNVFRSSGIQYTESVGHPGYRWRWQGQVDVGGEFFTQKKYALYGHPRKYHRVSSVLTSTQLGYSYWDGDGLCLATDPRSIPTYSDAYSSDTAMDALGATAIARVKPTNPIASLTAALAELKMDGLPHLPASQTWKDQALSARNAGSEYLNTQFGWMPLVSDISDFAGVVGHAHSVIEQYKRGIGKNIRRTYDFPTERTITETNLGPAYPYDGGGSGPYTGGGAVAGTLYRTKEVVRNRWFKGAFTYYFPSEILGSKRLADLAVLAHQLGLEPSPEVVWQVAPWSWAIDWFSNTGDVISNWTSFHEDGLVMRYGYMMEHTIINDTYNLLGAKDISGSPVTVSPVRFITETKVRRKANPYGFGVSWNGLSDFQASILVALGMSRT